MSDEVGSFYDQHPYPPPAKDLDGYGRHWEDPRRRRADYHLHWPDQPYREGLNILVAGCGTSQAARHALRNPANQVTGIDISPTSIQHTEELKHRYQLTNLVVHQLPIERVHELGQGFDLVICTGVLHHLPDPDAGLRALKGVLKSGGAIDLMVYATYGRIGVYMLQDYCRRLEIGRSDGEILELANTLMALPRGHPLGPLLADTPDFRTKAGLADALLHPQDRSYTVPQFLEFIDRAGLRFGRWVRQAPYLPQCGAVAQSPHRSRLGELAEAEQYAAMELFRGTMLRHSAIAYHNDDLGNHQPFQVDDGDWPDYTPIRLPSTICVEERAPRGAAAMLVNQANSDPDLLLPIDAGEKRLFECIDGQRSIVEILRRTERPDCGPQDRKRARHFFQRLWWFDQVVFDASNVFPSHG
jgi:SAM-dependent methyltransferase